MNDVKKITKEDVLKALSGVYDPEIPINIVDLGLIYKVEVNENNDVDVDMTFTTMACPMHAYIKEQASDAVKKMAGAGSVSVKLVWEPKWTSEMISKEIRERLNNPEE